MMANAHRSSKHVCQVHLDHRSTYRIFSKNFFGTAKKPLVTKVMPEKRPGKKTSGPRNFLPLFRIRIRPDPKLFGLKDLDPKSLIPDPAPDPPLFHTKLRNMFKNVLKSEQSHHNFIHNT